MINQNEISVDRIDIHARGITPQVTCAAADGLEREVMSYLAREGLGQETIGKTIQLGDLNLGTLSLKRSGNATELRREIARAIAREVAARMRRK